MDEGDWLAERFQIHRAHLHAVAYRMLGSLSEADDAVQEAWLRLSRAGTGGVRPGPVADHGGRAVCLDMLRSRAARREEPLGVHLPDPIIGRPMRPTPSRRRCWAMVGLALLVVLEELAPAERLALVLHDTFAVPFEEIAAILGRSPAAARQPSRARRRVRASTTLPDAPISPASAGWSMPSLRQPATVTWMRSLRAGPRGGRPRRLGQGPQALQDPPGAAGRGPAGAGLRTTPAWGGRRW